MKENNPSGNFIKQYWPIIVTAAVGLIMWLGGEYIKGYNEYLGKKCVELGTIAITGVVIGALMRLKHFSEMIKDHLAEVIYNPNVYQGHNEIVNNWNRYTERLMSTIMPPDFKINSKILAKKFFNKKNPYHFSCFDVKYVCKKDPISPNIIDITETFVAEVLPSPGQGHISFKNGSKIINGKETIELISIDIDKVPFTLKGDELVDSANDQDEKNIIFSTDKLDDYTIGENFTIKIVTKFKQDIQAEPYVSASFARYSNTGAVSVLSPEGYRTSFKWLGDLNADTKGKKFFDIDHKIYGKRWIWKEKAYGHMLPGQGFIVILCKE